MAEQEIKLKLSADGSAAIAGINKVGASLNKFESATGSLVSKIKAHWLGFTAAIAGTMLALNKAWSLAEMAAAYEDQKAILNSLAGQYNTSASKIISNIQDISRNMISMKDIVDISTQAMSKGLAPDKLQELARYADAFGDALSMSAAEGFRALAEAAALGHERTVENIVGIIDLNAALGEQVNKMSDTEKAQARYNIMLERLKNLYPDVGKEALSNADKMEQLRATVQDLQLHLGTNLIRGVLGATAAFQGLAAGIMYAVGALTYLAEKGGWVSAIISPLGMILKKAGVDSATAFATAEELAGKSVKNFSAMIASSEDLAKAIKKNPVAEQIEEIKKIEEAYEKWIKSIDDLNPALNKNAKALNKLQEEAEEFIKAGRNAVEVNKELMRAISYLEAIEKAEKYREAVKSQMETIKEQIDALKSWRQTAVDAYNDAINRANAYYNTAKSLDEALLKSKSFLEGIKEKTPKIFGFEEEKRTLQSSIQIAFNTKDVNEVLKIMEQIEEFISKYKDKKEFLGFDINLSDIIASYENLINRLENFRDINQQAGDAWINKSIEITTAIQQIDKYVSELDIKLQSLQAILNVDQAVQAAQYLKGEIDFYLPDIMYKTIVIKTVGEIGAAGSGEESSFYGFTQDQLIGYQSGTPYVPKTGSYMLHQGEAVIPANQNTYSTKNSQITININGANKSPQEIATEVDKVLAKRARYNRSEFAKAGIQRN